MNALHIHWIGHGGAWNAQKFSVVGAGCGKKGREVYRPRQTVTTLKRWVVEEGQGRALGPGRIISAHAFKNHSFYKCLGGEEEGEEKCIQMCRTFAPIFYRC